MNKPMSEVDSVIQEINADPEVSGKFWFRSLHVQPKDNNFVVRDSDTETLVFVTALDIANDEFIDKNAANDIIE